MTSQYPPELRWRSDGSGYYNQGYISRAIKKYGWENVRHYILLQTDSEDEAFKAEKFAIQYLHANEREHGYNISPGGEAGAKGVRWSEERKRAFSEKYSGVNHPMYGKHHTEKTRQKMKASAANRPPVTDETKEKLTTIQRENKGVSVVCFETGEVFPTVIEAAESIGCNSANISAAISSFPNRTCKGFHWYKAGDDISSITIS